MDLDHHSGNQVLLKTKLRHPEVVNHVLGTKRQFDWPVHGNCEHAVNRIVFHVGIGFIQANEIERRVVDEFRLSTSEYAILSG